VVEGSEACDEGEANSDTRPDACRLDCSAPRCGAGVVDAGEACEPPPDGALDDGRPDCSLSAAALERERADAARLRAEVETLRTQAEDARVAADAARGRADELEATAAAAASPDVIAALVAARVDLERKAAMVSPGLRCDGLTDRELMARSIGFEAGEAHSDDYVRARFDAAVEQRTKADGSVARAHVAAAASGEHISIAEAARRRMIARQSRGEV
jgi:hypothetical protein